MTTDVEARLREIDKVIARGDGGILFVEIEARDLRWIRQLVRDLQGRMKYWREEYETANMLHRADLDELHAARAVVEAVEKVVSARFIVFSGSAHGSGIFSNDSKDSQEWMDTYNAMLAMQKALAAYRALRNI